MRLAASGLMLLALLALLALAPAAHAGNDDGVLIGTQAAHAAGAVTAVAADGNALWYNPAGLAAVRIDTVDVNASAFLLRIYRVPKMLEADTGESADGEVVEFVSVPSGLSYVRPINDRLRIGYGVFVPAATNLELRTTLDLERPSLTTRWLINYAVSEQRYHAGAGLAWALSERVRFGFGVFGVAETGSVSAQFSGGATDPETGTSPGFVGDSQRASIIALGLEARLGLQWELAEGWTLGLAVRAPRLRFFTSISVDGVGGAATIGPFESVAIYAPSSVDVSEWGADLAEPARVRLGLAHTWEGGWASVDVDVQHALEDDEAGVEREVLFNARVGTRVTVAEGVILGGGLFTDLSPNREPTAFTETDVDFFGATVGVELLSDHKLGSGEPTDRLSFSTSFGLRYALGLGSVGGLAVRFYEPDSPGELVSEPVVDMTVHEISLELGSALYF